MKRLFIIAGCNGAGKTTASYTILPDILKCSEFVNADEIARGLSPFNPDKSSFQAGRLMLKRINELMNFGDDFAFETTLATKSYKNYVVQAQKKGYEVTLLFFFLKSSELAINRVKIRVEEGGHNIPQNIIIRRYENGLNNFFSIFKPIVDKWIFIDNSERLPDMIAKGDKTEYQILKLELWNFLKQNYDEGER
ncbi:zeta toxin family protein [Aequorivita capsosiphonis]|uniref:zeta toxin family protein n=1 Tax=Aequorivita capsosiphonis TaxID=487317 RepID=UPI00041F4A75|nr:zeta toxin family protein [Aequorivita capsosiphonis]